MKNTPVLELIPRILYRWISKTVLLHPKCFCSVNGINEASGFQTILQIEIFDEGGC